MHCYFIELINSIIFISSYDNALGVTPKLMLISFPSLGDRLQTEKVNLILLHTITLSRGMSDVMRSVIP